MLRTIPWALGGSNTRNTIRDQLPGWRCRVAGHQRKLAHREMYGLGCIAINWFSPFAGADHHHVKLAFERLGRRRADQTQRELASGTMSPKGVANGVGAREDGIDGQELSFNRSSLFPSYGNLQSWQVMPIQKRFVSNAERWSVQCGCTEE